MPKRPWRMTKSEHPSAPVALAPWARSGARRFVGDLGRLGVNQHEGLGQLGLGYWRESNQLGTFGKSHAGAAGSADAAFVSGLRLAGVVRGLLDLDFGCMTVLGVIMLVTCVSGAQDLRLLCSGDLGRRMMRTHPAEQHRRSRQSLERDRNHDKPGKKEPKARHHQRIESGEFSVLGGPVEFKRQTHAPCRGEHYKFVIFNQPISDPSCYRDAVAGPNTSALRAQSKRVEHH